ncbi:hypothetical protein ACWCL1_02700 [Ligilactobacillus sp. LYQ135]
MSLNDEERHFYDQDDEQPLRRSQAKQNKISQEEPLRRHQARDEKNALWKNIKNKLNQKNKTTAPLEEPESKEEELSRVSQRQKSIDEENERKAQVLGKKLNRAIYILIGLIVLTYLFMRFVNF